MGFRMSGFYSNDLPIGHTPNDALGVSVHGSLAQLAQEARSGRIDEVYIALPMSAEEQMQELISELGDSSLPVHAVPDLFTFNLINARMRTIGGLPVISIYDSPMDSYNTLLKRIEDLLLGTLIVLLCALPMLIIAIAIKLDSRGPVLFRQRRYGLNGEEIRVWKFRTMTVTEDGHAITQAHAGDRRITRVGRVLRRSSLDELPQFFNVLAGSMSIVGPRPHAVAHNEEYRQRIQGYMQRHLVKPGITGWAQINGWRGETDTLEKMEKRIEHDLHYIRNWSLLLDLKIIFLTVFIGFFHRNAY
jgi:putative colanic acid biosynthesis UDP-glucose lipid carrier transferase